MRLGVANASENDRHNVFASRVVSVVNVVVDSEVLHGWRALLELARVLCLCDKNGLIGRMRIYKF